jgi:hypothetical protein
MPSEDRPPRKDRLIQTRVPKQLETTLKEEARRRRLTVSHLIRNMLEESFQLVDGFVADVDQIVNDSAKLARNVSRGARRVVEAGRPEEVDAERPEESEDGGPGEIDTARAEPPERAEEDLSHVYAWNEVVLHQPVVCSVCATEIARGASGHAGLSDEPGKARAWLCSECVREL